MQPSAASDNKDVLVSSQLSHCRHESLNSESFWRKKVNDVAVDEVFFHKYFSQIGKGNGTSGKNDKPVKRGEDSRGDDDRDETEVAIWHALIGSLPEVEGCNADDGDIELLDLDDTSDIASSTSDLGIEADDNEVASTGDFDGALVDSGQDGEYHVNELFNRESQKQLSGNPSVKQSEEISRKRRRLRNLPTFASMEDYAEMLGEDEENM
jgi:ribosome biogenesis protein MAK21